VSDDISGSGLFNPVTVLGSTGTGLKTLAVDSSGNLMLTLAPGASVSISAPLDASGSVKTSVQNIPSVTITNPVDGSGNVKVAVQGNVQSQIIGPVDGSGNVKVAIQGVPPVTISGPVDGSGNVKVAVQGTATVAVSGTVTVAGTVTAICGNDGTSDRKLSVDTSGRLKVLPAVDYGGTFVPIMLDTYGFVPVSNKLMPLKPTMQKERLAGTVSATGQLDLYGTAVPTGKIMKVTTVGFQYIGTPPAVCLNSTHDGSYPYPLARYASPTSGSWNVWTGEVWLGPGMKVHWRFANATAGDSYVCYYIGLMHEVVY